MPEVKWVQKYSLRDGPQPIETGPITFVPVLTLDDLEAWLKEERDKEADGLRNVQYIMAFDDLLAQVQAMRGELP
jgi:hypothetical protein